jgi:hypothetical protein
MQVTDCLKNSCIGEEKARYNREISLPPGENRSSEITLFLTTLVLEWRTTLRCKPLYFPYGEGVQVKFPGPIPIRKWSC